MKKTVFRQTVAARCIAAVALVMAWPHGACAAADDVASLYAPQPPADAAYLRVLNASAQSARVVLSGSVGAQTLAPGEVTRLSVVTHGMPMRVTIDGRPLPLENSGAATAAAATAVAAGEALTIALAYDAKGWHATRISGTYARVDGLKATLHAFNFAPGCSAKISLGGDGPTVFDPISAGAQTSRAINPVSATLVGQCGAVKSAPLRLPPLAAGDSYSLFLTGDASKPELIGVRDALAWPPAAR
jgi:alginate O-acetyltransferase complex protein AlgF